MTRPRRSTRRWRRSTTTWPTRRGRGSPPRCRCRWPARPSRSASKPRPTVPRTRTSSSTRSRWTSSPARPRPDAGPRTSEGSLALFARRKDHRAMRNLLWLVPVAAFFLNPSLACSDEPQFQYGAAEMRAAVEGDWSLTITPAGGTAMQVTVHVEQAQTPPGATAAHVPGRALVRAAHACGTRTLVKGAGACTDQSEMPVNVTYVDGDASFATATLSGQFLVRSLAFTTGELYLKLGDYQIGVTVNA